MYTLAIIIQIIVSLIIIGTVLLQVGKGSDMGSAFGGSTGSQALFGASGPATFLAKVTAICAAIFMVTSLYLTYHSSRSRSASVMSNAPAVTEPVAPAAPETASPAVPVSEPVKK
ncbi:MAG: preprotein translocase subunit SecG [Deltaproteobacteria bacterium]|nr:preprotein translocase subunit SecG [Deltaproteobacteria bacterium]